MADGWSGTDAGPGQPLQECVIYTSSHDWHLGLTEVGYAPEKIEYGVNRYVNETRRLYRTLDTHLQKSTSGFIVGDRLTIADISIWGWVAGASMLPSPFLLDPLSPLLLIPCE